MRLEWLEDLLAVAETGSFSEAASRRHLTQSAFSRRIRSIEDHVGVELFDRTRKPVQLRPGTLDQHERIRQVAQTLRQLELDLKRSGSGLENRIVLASQHALTTSLTPALVQRIRTLPGDIQVRLRSANLDQCFGLLLACQADRRASASDISGNEPRARRTVFPAVPRCTMKARLPFG
jgi:DNA-binding transcriptional LysR family regulator